MIVDEAEARAFVESRGDARAIERIECLIADLRAENARQNLVEKHSLEIVWQRHVADSVQLLDHAGTGDGAWLDLGSGAGFPGLVIAAMRPHMPVFLVESRRRRIEWLEDECRRLELPKCVVIGRRLEHVDAFGAQTISARAFAPLDRLLELSARFSTGDTHWVLPKGRSAAQEVAALGKRGQEMFHVEQSQTDEEAGIVVGRGRWRVQA